MLAAADGPFFSDGEFETLMGATRKEVRHLAAEWSTNGSAVYPTDIAANVLNNLLGYPHGRAREVESVVGCAALELERVLALL